MDHVENDKVKKLRAQPHLSRHPVEKKRRKCRMASETLRVK